MWSVIRTDDNGNTFVIEENLTRGEAEDLIDTLESRGHKQLYEIQEQPFLG